jgi:hypothetical protein
VSAGTTRSALSRCPEMAEALESCRPRERNGANSIQFRVVRDFSHRSIGAAPTATDLGLSKPSAENVSFFGPLFGTRCPFPPFVRFGNKRPFRWGVNHAA